MFQLSGTLDIHMEDIEATLTMEGLDLTLESDNPGDMLKSLNIQKSRGLATVRTLAEELDKRGLTLTVVSRGKKVLVMGRKAEAGITSRMLRAPHVEIGSGTEVARILAT